MQAIANERFAARMAEMDSDQWAARFDETGVPYAPVQTREWAASETVAANDLLLPIPGAEGAVGPGLPAVLSRTPGTLAQSTVGNDDAPEVTVPGNRLPLDGLLVVDATKYLAGPFGCLVLQDLGARVVKVDPPGGEEFRAVAGASYSALNRDKDQVCLDLKDAAGREGFTALVLRADALVENMARQVAEDLGLDLDALRAGNPGLVHTHIDGWGKGPLADTPGFDPLLQARSGIMVAQGGLDHPVIQPMSLHDIGTGTLAAFGTIAGLYARTHLGEGQDVGVALSRTSVTFQGGEYTTAPDLAEPVLGYIDYVGDEPDHCLVEASDGWLAVAATTDEQRAAWSTIRAAPAERTVAQVVDSVSRRWRPRDRGARARRGVHDRRARRRRLLARGRRRRPRRGEGHARLFAVGRRANSHPARDMRAAGRDTERVLAEVRTSGGTNRPTIRRIDLTNRSYGVTAAETEVDQVVDARPAVGVRALPEAARQADRTPRARRARRRARDRSLPSSANGSVQQAGQARRSPTWRPGACPPPTLSPFHITARVVAAISLVGLRHHPLDPAAHLALGRRLLGHLVVEVAAAAARRRPRGWRPPARPSTEVPVEGVVRQAGRGDDVGDAGPRGGAAPAHDLEAGVEQAADLGRVVGARSASVWRDAGGHVDGGPVAHAIAFCMSRILFCHEPGKGNRTWPGTSRPSPSSRRSWTGPTSSCARRSSRSTCCGPDLAFTPLDEPLRKVIDPLKERCAPRTCGPPTSAPSSAARATAS